MVARGGGAVARDDGVRDRMMATTPNALANGRVGAPGYGRSSSSRGSAERANIVGTLGAAGSDN